MATEEVRSVQVDFAGLMEVVGKNLYSTPVVAVRELVQNAHDSCVRRSLEAGTALTGTITIRCLTDVLEIEDNGAGLTHQEIIDYLATIGAGYTRKLREQHADADLIGAFGLGFLSAYVLSDRVEVLTTSYKEPDRRWRFASQTGERFTLGEASAEGAKVGTLVRLHLKEEYSKLGNPLHLDEILRTYCCLLPLPVMLQGIGQINDEPPPWLQDEKEIGPVLAKKKRLEFATRFERLWEPLATLPIPPAPELGFRGGLAWVQDGRSYATSDHRSASVFVRGMLITRDERELLPVWGGFIGAVLDSRMLTPTASREDLVDDQVYARTQVHVRNALIQGLEELAKREPAAWRRTLRRHNESLRGAAVSDPRLFALVADQLTLPTTEGELTMPVIARRSKEVHLSLYDRRGPDEVLFRALQTPIIDGMRFAAYAFVKEYCDRRGLPLIELGTREGNELMFKRVELDEDKQARLDELFAREKIEVVATRFKPDTLPLVLTYDQEVKLKRKMEDDEQDKRISTAVLGLARLFTNQIDDTHEARLYVNLDNKVIDALVDLGRDLDQGTMRQVASLLFGIGLLMAPSADTGERLDDTLAVMNKDLLALLG
jgi:molecular chaperone HtpG